MDHATKMVVYHSNNYRFLKASFHGTCVKVEKCGIDLIYAKDDGLNHNTKLRDHLEYFGDNGYAGETAIHNVKGRSENQPLAPPSLDSITAACIDNAFFVFRESSFLFLA